MKAGGTISFRQRGGAFLQARLTHAPGDSYRNAYKLRHELQFLGEKRETDDLWHGAARCLIT